MRALDGIRVLDLTHILSGPFSTLMLADLGAEVIKIERPGVGEATRRLLSDDAEHSVHGMGAYFLSLNRNKKSVTLDLTHPDGRALFGRLVGMSDVVVYNFSYGVADRLGISRQCLADAHPHIITCSITGFGETGPNRENTSFDMVAQATGGGMSLTGEADAQPTRAGLPVGDLGGGMAATVGILAALHARHTTGIGRHVDISLQDVQISMLSYMATMYSLSGRIPPRMGNGHFVHVPYDTFLTADNWMIVAVVGDEIWARLMAVLQCPRLDIEPHRTQPGRLQHRRLIERELAALFVTKPRAHWLRVLKSGRVPCAPVADISSVFDDPQVAARGMMLEMEHTDGGRFSAPGNPIKLSDAPPDKPCPPPQLGRDTDEVLTRLLGTSTEEIARLRTLSVI